ncbi:MAG: flavodoxin reductase [Porticoccaceae bacterium]|nr:flavodoxin reductase [Porticoccaceae bacterium]
MEHNVQILMTQQVTHDVKRFIVKKPPDFDFEPGQGVELAIDRPEWAQEGRPFTPTSRPGDGVLEFTIKGYPERDGVTRQLHRLEPGDQLLISAPFGAIRYRGLGTFIAGGAGITPFLSIIREQCAIDSMEAHDLIFSNRTPRDVICEKELRYVFGDRATFTCTREAASGYDHRRVDEAFLKEKIADFNRNFYVCGPPKFTEEINAALEAHGARGESLIFEK